MLRLLNVSKRAVQRNLEVEHASAVPQAGRMHAAEKGAMATLVHSRSHTCDLIQYLTHPLTEGTQVPERTTFRLQRSQISKADLC